VPEANTFGRTGLLLPRASTTAAAPASVTRATTPRVPRREGVLGSLSITNSAATATRAAVRACGRISGVGKPWARPSINAAMAAVDRNPVATPATTARERIPGGRITGRSASSGYGHATQRPLWRQPSLDQSLPQEPQLGGRAAASLVPRPHSEYPAGGRLTSSPARALLARRTETKGRSSRSTVYVVALGRTSRRSGASLHPTVVLPAFCDKRLGAARPAICGLADP
jgi:hypothetical protein